jgi:hypothetical protein
MPLINELPPNLDPSIRRRFGRAAGDSRVKRAAAALEANGITVAELVSGTENLLRRHVQTAVQQGIQARTSMV